MMVCQCGLVKASSVLIVTDSGGLVPGECTPSGGVLQPFLPDVVLSGGLRDVVAESGPDHVWPTTQWSTVDQPLAGTFPVPASADGSRLRTKPGRGRSTGPTATAHAASPGARLRFPHPPSAASPWQSREPVVVSLPGRPEWPQAPAYGHRPGPASGHRGLDQGIQAEPGAVGVWSVTSAIQQDSCEAGAELVHIEPPALE